MPDFQEQLEAFGQSLATKADRLLTDEALEALSEVQAQTPVNTGRAQAAWQLTKDGEGNLVLSNDTPYIAALEFGTPNRPPAAMLRQGLDGLQARLQS